MLRTFGVALFAVAMSVGLAQAKGQRTPMCAEGKQATATCLCGVGSTRQAVLCQKGQWCHGWPWPGMRACTS
jgi:hypothetical protein